MDSIVRLFEPLLRLLLPGAGRHRSAVTRSVSSARCRPPGHRAEFERWERAEQRLRRRRRREWWVTAYGMEVA
ncbi:hypothetical protein [Streptomyces sp. NPDC059863]|uniref:hypothetical protein n=1 Tax=unclassified Streptomyces TaxID=2593676 RepID=UPI0036645CB6